MERLTKRLSLNDKRKEYTDGASLFRLHCHSGVQQRQRAQGADGYIRRFQGGDNNAADTDHSGRLNLGVGVTLGRHSNPEAEVAETRAKVAGLRAALGIHNQFSTGPRSQSMPAKAPRQLAAHPEVRKALDLRNATLARFWLDPPCSADQAGPLTGRRVLVIDAEDTFTAMLSHQLRSLGLRVTITRFDQAIEHPENFDLVVIGSSPGDPNNRTRVRNGKSTLG